jgi:hypothetical protein
MSARAELAQRIADFVCEHDLAQVYGGDVSSAGRYRAIGFSRCASLDGEVRVYGPKFIQVLYQTRDHTLPREDAPVFTSEEHALEFLRLAFVEHDGESALEIPTKTQAK